MKIAACYIRVSTDDQLEYSPDSQLSAIQTYAKNNEYILPKEFIFIEQEGRSGRNAQKREAFQKMIGTAKLKPKPFDTLLLWKFSRFARNREDSIVYKSMLRKQGIDVISISEPIGDDKMSVILEAMIEAMDEYYSINLAEEVRRGMTEKAKRGEPVSIAPFGYIMKNKKLIIEPEKADIIREVFQRFADGQAIRSIVVWLNSIGIRTKRGNVLENRIIDYWLQNPVYHGYIRWTPTERIHRDFHNPNSLTIQGEHEPIISEDLWNTVQERIKQNKLKHSRYARSVPSDSFILSGIVKCAVCGRSMGKSTQIYMQCTGYGRGQCTSSQCCKIDDIMQMIRLQLAADIANSKYPIAQPSKTYARDDMEILTKQIEREKEKLFRAKEAYLSGIDTADEYKAIKTRLTAEIERLKAEYDKLSAKKETINTTEYKAQMQNHITDVFKLLDSSATNREKNAALKSIIEKVIYSKEEATLQIFYH